MQYQFDKFSRISKGEKRWDFSLGLSQFLQRGKKFFFMLLVELMFREKGFAHDQVLMDHLTHALIATADSPRARCDDSCGSIW